MSCISNSNQSQCLIVHDAIYAWQHMLMHTLRVYGVSRVAGSAPFLAPALGGILPVIV